MIKSMTGYGRCESVTQQRKIVLEVKSVNNRYCDVSIKLPRAYGYLEDKIRERVSREIARGKVDVYVYIENYCAGVKEISINLPLAESYMHALQGMGESLGLTNDVTLMGLTRFSDIFISKEQDDNQDEMWEQVRAVLEPALADFVAMREREGQRMEADIRLRADNVLGMVAKVESLAPRVVEAYAQKVRTRMTELLGDFPIDENRLLTEVGVMADRVCISEELVRLRSHFTELEKILQSSEPVGRKLDFLVQEINRETNTIGSKANDMEIARLVVDMKSEIEKFREQIQNIE